MSAQDQLYREAAAAHDALMLRMASGYERDPERRRDLLQTMQVELWRSFASFVGDCSVKSWVCRIAHNVGVSHMIRERRQRPDALVPIEEVEIAGVDDPEALLDLEQRRARLLALVHQLRPADRQIVLLHLEDLTPTEIGEVVGLEPGHVSVRLHRAKSLLATMNGDTQ